MRKKAPKHTRSTSYFPSRMKPNTYECCDNSIWNLKNSWDAWLKAANEYWWISDIMAKDYIEMERQIPSKDGRHTAGHLPPLTYCAYCACARKLEYTKTMLRSLSIEILIKSYLILRGEFRKGHLTQAKVDSGLSGPADTLLRLHPKSFNKAEVRHLQMLGRVFHDRYPAGLGPTSTVGDCDYAICATTLRSLFKKIHDMIARELPRQHIIYLPKLTKSSKLSDYEFCRFKPKIEIDTRHVGLHGTDGAINAIK